MAIKPMVIKHIRQIIILLIFATNANTFAQNTQHPFQTIDKDLEVLTLSNGKYNEFFDTDSIEIIGDAIYNTYTKKVVGFVEHDTTYSEATLNPEITSRWLSPDPLAAKYPDLSPYHFVRNSPILFNDPDGRDFNEAIVDKNGNATEALIALVSNIGINNQSARDANFISTITPPCIGCAAINLYPNIYYDNDVGETTFRATKSQIKLAAHELSHFDELFVVERDFGKSGVGAWYLKYILESTESAYLNIETEVKAYNYEDIVGSFLEREFDGEVNFILNLFDNNELTDQERARAINTAFAFWEQQEGPIMKMNPLADGEQQEAINGKRQFIDTDKGTINTQNDETSISEEGN